MQTDNYMKLNEIDDLEKAADYVASVMKNGGVVLIPTDTVYGLICMPSCRAAVEMIFKMKDRPFNVNLPVICSDKEQARDALPTVWTAEADALASAFWPGAMTIAVGIRENNVEWLRGRVEMGIRVPDAPLIRLLARKLGPLVMTSANRHGVPTPHTVQGALESLTCAPALTIDGGELSGLPSTLVNVNLPEARVERKGTITEEEVEKVLKNG